MTQVIFYSWPILEWVKDAGSETMGKVELIHIMCTEA